MTLIDNTLSLSHSPVPVPFFTRLLSILELIQLTLISENPLVWSFTKGRVHPRADMVGPAYVVGAPSVNCAPGEAVLASTLDLKNSPLFLFSGKILGQNGEPVEAKLDMWQAGTTTGYAFSTYQNRGVVTTNPSTGAFEVLTVPPGAYGPSSSTIRAGHIHAIISAPGYQSVVTQFYICPKNDPKAMDTDPLNWFRAKRLNNIVECWAIPTDKGDRYGDLPQLDDSDTHTASIVKKWNERLESEGLRIACGGSDVIRLNKA